MKIYKYPLDLKESQLIRAGKIFVRPIAVAEQAGKLMLWAETVEATRPLNNNIRVHIIPTGDFVIREELGEYLGTVVMSNNNEVWHVYVKVYAEGER